MSDPQPKDYGSPSREKGFTMAADLFRKNGGKLIVETGCCWMESQGRSTVHLAELAAEVGGEFVSIDNNPSHVEYSRALLSNNLRADKRTRTNIVCADSLDWLGWVSPCKIDLLYLDAFDHDESKPNLLGIYNVAELGACLGRMSAHSVILMDDWNYGKGHFIKCALSRELLLYRGWKLLNEDYQLLFAR